jgi:hypothetical protein
MRDLWIHENDLIVGTHGRSFWILDDISPIRQAAEDAAKNDLLFNPATAIRVPRSTWAETPVPPDETLGENPPDGAIIDYYLAQNASGQVTIEILDAKGQLVRKYSSDDKPDLTAEQLQKQMIPPYWVRLAKNPATSAGMHRFVWDMSWTAPTSVTREYPITAVPHNTPRYPLGPKAAPGKYTVRLTLNGKSYTAPLTLKLDPRVKTPQAALDQQFATMQKLFTMVDRSARAVLQAKSVQEQVAKLKPTGAAADAVKAFSAKVSTALDGPENAPANGPKPPTLSGVNGEAYELYKMIGEPDAGPTAAQVQAVAKVEKDFPAVVAAWDQIVKTDLPVINAQLKKAGLTEINPQEKPENGENQGDEE